MNWRDIDGSEIGLGIIQCLEERPYLKIDELVERLAVIGILIDENDLSDILIDPTSPFYHEPLRWFVFQDMNEEVQEQRATEESVHALEKNVVFNEDLSDVHPHRWIGPELRSWQKEAFKSWINNGEWGIVEAITGTGKTLVGIYAAAYVLDFEYKVVVVAPTLDLMDQWVKEFTRCIRDVKIGRMDGSNGDLIDDFDVLITTIASGSKYRLHSEKSDTLIISDEVHRMGSESNANALEPQMRSRLGLTATLERTNDDGVDEVLVPYFDSVIFTYGYADGLRDSVLAPFRLGFIAVEFTPDEQSDFDEYGSEMGRLSRKLKDGGHIRGRGNEIFAEIGALSKNSDVDFKVMRWAQKFMAGLSARKNLQASAENKISAIELLSEVILDSNKALVFTETKDAAANISLLLRDQGIEAYPFDSSLNRSQRSTRLDEFRTDIIQVLCAPRVLDEGIDVANVDVGVITAASQSKRQMIQRLGRIVRPNPDGVPSTLFLMYLKGTREDPAEGGHEGFLNEVLPYAEEIEHFDLDSNPSAIARWHQSY